LGIELVVDKRIYNNFWTFLDDIHLNYIFAACGKKADAYGDKTIDYEGYVEFHGVDT
jgi:hypothetical protein